jgi:hypothetical protein
MTISRELKKHQQVIGLLGSRFTEINEHPVRPDPIVRVSESLQQTTVSFKETVGEVVDRCVHQLVGAFRVVALLSVRGELDSFGFGNQDPHSLK